MTFQMALIFTTITTAFILQFESIGLNIVGFKIFTFFFTLSPYVALVLLADALWKIRNCTVDKN
jgi:hypothetical protein